MTDSEIKDWMSLLNDSNPMHDPKWTRRQMIEDLLNHSAIDKMTAEDKVICLRALTILKERDE